MPHTFSPPNIASPAEERSEDVIPRARAEHAREITRFGSRVAEALDGKEPEQALVLGPQDAALFSDGDRLQLGQDENPAERGNRLRLAAGGIASASPANAPKVIATKFHMNGKGWPLP